MFQLHGGNAEGAMNSRGGLWLRKFPFSEISIKQEREREEKISFYVYVCFFFFYSLLPPITYTIRKGLKVCVVNSMWPRAMSVPCATVSPMPNTVVACSKCLLNIDSREEAGYRSL